MADTNKHGLSRNIPADIQRQIRQECGFGCVICGRFPTQFDHFEPEYFDAKTHAPGGMALLCLYCHGEKTAKRLTTDQVRRARKSPFNIDKNPVWNHRLAGPTVTVELAGLPLSGSNPCLYVNEQPIIGANVMSGTNTWHLTGSLTQSGTQYLMFNGDTVMAHSGSWDVTLTGQVLRVDAASRKKVAEIHFNPETQQLSVLALHVRMGADFGLDIRDSRLELGKLGEAPTFVIDKGIASSSDGTHQTYYTRSADGRIDINLPSLGGLYDWLK